MTCFVHVYRWEDIDGVGPYNSLHSYTPELVFFHDSNDFVKHPTIWREFGDFAYNRTRRLPNLSAFASLDQARAWFTDEEEIILISCGWRLIKKRIAQTSILLGTSISQQILIKAHAWRRAKERI